jgi:3-oxoacyl-[acyl-carrier-protein] synthase-3
MSREPVRAKITGTGMYVPDRVVTNDELAGMMDTSDEWIRQRTGIVERHWVEDGQTPVDLAEAASRQALETAGLEASDIDCILLGTLSPEADFPGTSFFLQHRLGLEDTPCMDVRGQCSGFLYSLNLADALIQARKYRRLLVVGCELHSTGLDKTTRGRDVTVIFGDGSGAVVLEANDDSSDPGEVLEIRLHSQGEHARRLWVESPGSGKGWPDRLTHEMLDDGSTFPQMEGRFVFKHAVTRMPEVLLETLDAASVKLADVDLFLFHQANLRINEYVAQKLEIPAEKLLSNIERYGNCSAGSIPMLLAEADRNGQLERGQLVSMTAFGAGFSWASAVVRW